MSQPGEPYTKKENYLIKQHYPRRGAIATTRILKNNGFNRSLHSVTQQASKMCAFAEVPGYIRLIDVDGKNYPQNRQVSRRALKAAEDDGVILLVEAGRLSYRLVPVEWADEYVKKSEAMWQADEQCADSWWDSRRVAEEFGLAARTIQNAVGGKAGPALGRAMSVVVRRRGVKQWYFEPVSVKQAALQFRSETGSG